MDVNATNQKLLKAAASESGCADDASYDSLGGGEITCGRNERDLKVVKKKSVGEKSLFLLFLSILTDAGSRSQMLKAANAQQGRTEPNEFN